MAPRNMADPTPSAPPDAAPLRFAEFAVLVAAVISLGAIGVDLMLPALPAMGRDLGIGARNARQFIITVYLIGLGVGQLLHGPLADSYGRRRSLGWAMAVLAVTSTAAAITTSFGAMLALRLVSGIAAAATRTITVAIIRDCYSGRAMARTTSLVMIVFMIAPVLAPTLGHGILLAGSWRLIFWAIAAFCTLILAWFLIRLPETLAIERRQPISPARIVARWRRVVTDRTSLGYMLAATALQGGLFGYITSVQQLVSETFDRPALLNIVFGVTAGFIAIANLLNSQIVMRFGSRLLSHAALLAMIALSVLALAIHAAGAETLWSFVAVQSVTMGCYALANSNFSAMAMETMGDIAGTAASVQGFSSITVGTIVGAVIGQSFAGTTVPLHAGFLVTGVIALVMVVVTERGRLFHAHNPAPA